MVAGCKEMVKDLLLSSIVILPHYCLLMPSAPSWEPQCLKKFKHQDPQGLSQLHSSILKIKYFCNFLFYLHYDIFSIICIITRSCVILNSDGMPLLLIVIRFIDALSMQHQLNNSPQLKYCNANTLCSIK